ncbi:MAG: Mov34/MPN/PAD-1 family protein [Bacillota bacterium]|nr:Mov34/MPN/PAD-1 family protein [Bacillota bacterium]
MSANSPDVSEIKLDSVIKKNFPCKYDYRIFISEKAYKNILEHAASNTSVEIGGVLIGSIYHDHAGYYLEITDSIIARKTENSGANVTFTHDTWADILNKKDSKFSDKLIVGWYHSHPDFDIFLSSQDMHIHENFFNQAHQVAFVVDPIRNTEGFFIWKNGKPELIDEYWTGDIKKTKSPKKLEPEVAKLNGETCETSENDMETSKSSLLNSILKWGLLALYAFAILFMAFMNFNLKYNLSLAQNKIHDYEQFLSVTQSVYMNQYNSAKPTEGSQTPLTDNNSAAVSAVMATPSSNK